MHNQNIRYKAIRFAESDKQYLLDRVSITGDSECWLWQGLLNGKGYGRVVLPGQYRTRYLAHRLSYTMFVGPIPDGMLVCHTCDVHRCVNPSHLFVGTPHDNTQDMMRKGRNYTGIRPTGERNHWTKLTDAQVVEVWTLRAEGLTMTQIAKRYGVTSGCIWHILHGLNRKHVKVPQLPSMNQTCIP